MNFFKKKKQQKNPSERNEIENKGLKEYIANAAMGILKEGADYEKLAHTKVTFGYLFVIEDHGIEALLKVITDKKTIYFAVQGEKMLMLNLSEKVFQDTVESFLALHN